MAEKQNDLTRTILGALFIVALIGISLWILLPFLAAIIWAATIVAATWPLMIKIQSWLWGRRWAAVTVMTLILLCVLVVPLSAAIGVIVSNTDTIIGWAKSLAQYEITTAPEWVRRLPFVGVPAAEAWNKLAASGYQGIAARAWPYAGGVIKWFVSHVGSLGALFVQFLLTVILSALLYANGERAAEGVLRFGQRLAGTARGGVRPSGRAGHPRHRPRGGGDGPGPVGAGRNRPADHRSALCPGPDRGHVYAGHRPDRPHSRAGGIGGLALLERQRRLGGRSCSCLPWWWAPWTTFCGPT